MKALLQACISCYTYLLCDSFPRKDVNKPWYSIWHQQSTTFKKGGRSYQCPPNSCRNLVIPAESSGMKFGRMACYFLHSGVISFQWNLGIPELRLECSMESGCLVTTLFGIHCLFVAHLLTNKHNVLPFPPPTIVSHHHYLSFPPPPTMLVTAANNACHHHCPSWLLTNANNHQQLQHHHNQPKNKDGCQQTTTNAHPMNDGLDPRTDMGGDKPRWVNLPLLALHFIHMEYRCHVAVSDVAAKQWTTMLPMSSFIVVVNLGHHSEYPPSHICPNSPCWDTGQRQPGTMTWHGHGTTRRTQDEDVAKTGGDKDRTTRTGQQRHMATMTHSNNDTQQQWCMVTMIHSNKAMTILSLSHHPYPLHLTSPSL